METAPLKSFATWARTSLIREVTARITAVLAPGSPERVEQARTVAALERAVAAEGGGDKGRSAIAGKVAYTWFNRIIALRFMDANGYTGVGVVSPPSEVAVGQPEILADAKRGVIDPDAVSSKVRSTVAGLLDGSRPSGDPQGEAYALLLEAYCNHWHKAMPFMFEREGDYTELLIPANLLADDSVLNRAVQVLTPDVCEDVEVIGWLYQFYISERKDEVFAGFKKNKKAGPDEIPAATQLFTPHWIVRYLVENSLGRLWMLNHPSSRLVNQMDFYIAPIDVDTDFLRVGRPEELKIIDPACGSGHMLTYAFDLLYEIYEEEGYSPGAIPGLILAENLYGVEIDSRAGELAAFALTMKARSKQRSLFAHNVMPNICVLEPIKFTPEELGYLARRTGTRDDEVGYWNQFAEADTLGSLVQPDSGLGSVLAVHLESLNDDGDLLQLDTIRRAGRAIRQAGFLGSSYSVVVANPPYMGSKSMVPNLADFAKTMYQRSKSDLYSMFIERSLSLALPGGFVGMITMHSWMFLSTFAALREDLLQRFGIVTLAHLGSGAFDTIGGEVVSTAAFVIENRVSRTPGVYLGLAELSGEEVQSEASRAIAAGTTVDKRFIVSASAFSDLPLASMAYWLTSAERRIYRDFPRLASMAETRQGLATGDNNQFLRYWWEVSGDRTCRSAKSHEDAANSGARWFPVQKGGSPRRWVGNDDFVVDWEHGGQALLEFRPRSVIRNPTYYFRPGATWSSLSGDFAVRSSPAGCIFESKGSMLFPLRDEDLTWILGYLNTPIARELIDCLSPTLDYHEGPVGRIPVIPPVDQEAVELLVEAALARAAELWTRLEVSPQFDGTKLGLGPGPATTAEALAGERNTRLGLEEAILASEREIEAHFRLAGEIGPDVFPLEAQRPTGLLDPDMHDPSASARYLVEDLVSFSVGCMFGRYSLDMSGLILADQGASLRDFLVRIPVPTFVPDADNVIPIVDGDWFEDDIVERFRQFLRVAFGETHFEENLRFVTESLGVKRLRDYFVRDFYKDHVQRYKKRPIYWLFSSPQGSFNALIYMHRYAPSTVSTVLNEYLREFQAKLKVALEHAERSNNAKESDRLRKILLELDAYEHDVLYPLASQNISIDLDDGVKSNYPKLGSALKKIVGLEASE